MLRNLSRRSECSDFASNINFDACHATNLNSTYRAAGALQVASEASNLSNSIPLCEVYASVNYVEGARLVFALWLPDKRDHEQRFLAVGNGGYGGLIDTAMMMNQLNLGLGFAVAGGDAGHDAHVETNGYTFGQPGLGIPFLRHKQRTETMIRNAISIFTPLAKALTERY